jgi:hypothetical protein
VSIRPFTGKKWALPLSGHPVFGTTAALTVLTGDLRLDRTAA